VLLQKEVAGDVLAARWWWTPCPGTTGAFVGRSETQSGAGMRAWFLTVVARSVTVQGTYLGVFITVWSCVMQDPVLLAPR